MELHIARDGEQFGPFPPDEVRRQLAAGTLLPTDFAWAEGAKEWVALGSLPGLMPAPIQIGSAISAPPWQSPSTVAAAPDSAPVPRTSILSVVSLICGLLSITLILPGVAGIAATIAGVIAGAVSNACAVPIVAGLVAVICGHVARRKIHRQGGALAGEAKATAGLATGYIGLLLLALISLFYGATIMGGPALAFLNDAQMRAKRAQSTAQARQIVAACHNYGLDHKGAFPKSLDQLVPQYLPDRQVFVCPLSGPTLVMGYEYFGGSVKDPDDKILLTSKYQDPDGLRVVARLNGATSFERPPPQSLPTGAR